MGIERTERRSMVDRRERRHVQDGTRQDRQSERDVYHHRQRLGRDVEWETQGHVSIYDRPLESARKSISRAHARLNFSLKLRFDRQSDVRRRISLYLSFSPEETE